MSVINKSDRVYIVGDKHIIPGADPVELTADEAANSMIKAYIEAGHLAEYAEPAVQETPAEKTTDETKTAKAGR